MSSEGKSPAGKPGTGKITAGRPESGKPRTGRAQGQDDGAAGDKKPATGGLKSLAAMGFVGAPGSPKANEAASADAPHDDQRQPEAGDTVISAQPPSAALAALAAAATGDDANVDANANANADADAPKPRDTDPSPTVGDRHKTGTAPIDSDAGFGQVGDSSGFSNISPSAEMRMAGIESEAVSYLKKAPQQLKLIAGVVGAVVLLVMIIPWFAVGGSSPYEAFLKYDEPLQAGPGDRSIFPTVALLQRNESCAVLDEGEKYAMVRDPYGRVGYVQTKVLAEEVTPTGDEEFTLCRRRSSETNSAACLARAKVQYDSCQPACKADAECLKRCANRLGTCNASCQDQPAQTALDTGMAPPVAAAAAPAPTAEPAAEAPPAETEAEPAAEPPPDPGKKKKRAKKKKHKRR
jgi:hypothetical protein